jgi:eukaryotic-like serine/threonine-protein kinase
MPLARALVRSGGTRAGTGPASVRTGASGEAAAQALALVEGDVVADRYRVGPVIGAGGMGIVYKARHIPLGTWVALKVIRPDIAQNSSLWRRFAREARALGALHNKHVVRVHDSGTLPSGLRYMVMELLQGTDLRRLLAEHGAMTPAQAVDYVLQVCSALGDAHRLHIIHRDIKPENIFLATIRACEPTIKLLDFGVARFQDDAGQLTVPGRGVGSPRYLSPEQLQNPNAVDQRSDIWGVGLLLYELMTGWSPFEGMNTAQICLAICQGPIPPIESLRRDLPSELSAIIRRCLEVDPAARFQSADDLVAALEPFSSRHQKSPRGDGSAPVGPQTPAPPARKPWRLVPRWLCARARAARKALRVVDASSSSVTFAQTQASLR